MGMDLFAVAAGASLPLRGNLTDDGGQSFGYDAPGPALSAEVWPGGRRAESFAVAASWIDASAGEFSLLIRADQTAGLDPGRYRGQLLVLDPILGTGPAYEWLMDVVAAPGDEVEPPSYGAYGDLLVYARGWLSALQSLDVEAGFAQERGRARAWLDDLILAAAPSGPAGLGDPGYGAIAWGGTATGNPWLRGQLDAGLLIRRGWVVEATSKMALAYVCDGQIGPGDSGQQFANLGRMYRNQADSLAMSSLAELASVAGGPATYRVNLGVRSVR